MNSETDILKIRSMHVSLGQMPIRRSKAFFRAIFSSVTLNGNRFFTTHVEGQIRKVTDKGMNLEKYLALNWKTPFIKIDILNPSYPQQPEIRYLICICPDERLAEFLCPYNESNYNEFARLFRESYDKNLKSMSNLRG